MTNTDCGLTKQQKERTEHFLHLFSEIEQALKKRFGLRPNNNTGFRSLVDRYLKRNPFWADSARQLWLLADIRNLLTHNRTATHGYPVAITQRSVNALEVIKDHLRKPVAVAKRFRRKVDCVSAHDSLRAVVATAFEKGYSQFPVIAEQRFVGLITENEITRWLGRRAKENGSAVNLDDVTVKKVIREKEPFRKGIAISDFRSLNAPVEEVMGLFVARPMLEAVLLTKTGNRKDEIEGIITQWDAARFPSG